MSNVTNEGYLPSYMRRLPTVAHVTSAHKSDDNRIFNKECRTLANAGYNVFLIAPGEHDTFRDGVHIKAIPASRSRLERMTKTVWQAYRAAARSRAQICHLHDPELLTIALLLRLRGRIVIFDWHEDLVDDLLSKPYMKPWVRKVFSALFSCVLWAIRGSISGFVAATPAIARRFPPIKTAIVHNYPYVDELCGPSDESIAKLPQAIYLGGISKIRGIFEMIKSMEGDQIPASASLLIVGEFESNELFEQARVMPGWQKIRFLHWQPRKHLGSLLAESAVGLVLFCPEPSHFEAMPNKFFEYMASGLPVIVSDFPMWRALIEAEGCGICVDPMNPSAIASAIAFLLNSPEKAAEMGKAGRQAVLARYNWSHEADTLLRFYSTLLGNDHRRGRT